MFSLCGRDRLYLGGGIGAWLVMKINHRLPALMRCINNVLFVMPLPSDGDCMFQEVTSLYGL